MPLADLTWHALRWLPITVIAGGIAVAVTWWTYQPQLRLRSRVARIGLPTMRCAALIALAVALLKPVVHREKTAAERGTLVVLVDRSPSMGVTDTARTPAQLIAIADGLKLLPAGTVTREIGNISFEDVEQLRAQADRIIRAGSELDYARLADRGVEAAQGRFDDAASQMTTLAQSLIRPKEKRLNDRLNKLIAPPPGKEREQWLRELKSRVDHVGDAVAQTEGSAAVKLFRESAPVREAATRIKNLSRLELAKLAVQQALGGGALGHTPMAVFGFAGDVAPLDVSAEQETASGEPVSNITGSIRDAVAKFPRDGVRGVVVLSDGRQISGEGSIEAMAAAIGNVPVYTVRLAAATLPRDLSIGRVTVPGRAFVGETLTVRVDVRSVGIRGEVPVQLTHGEQTQRRTLKFNDDATLAAEFSLKLDRPGAARLRIAVTPQAGEISPANNTVERWVNVLSDKIRVVAIAQSAGRDYQFCRDALQRTAWVTLDEHIAAGPDSQGSIEPDKLAAADVVLLEDAGPNLLSPLQWQQIKQLVTDRGAGLILLAGDAHLPGELLAQPEAAALLPLAEASAAKWRTWAGEWPSLRPVPFRLPGDRSRLPDALRLAEDADSSLRRWQELPPLFRLMTISPLKPNAAPLLVDAETKLPVMVETRHGSGRTLLVGLNETWRWRYKVGQRDQDRFWLQLVRQVSDEPYAVTINDGGQVISLDADKLLIDAGRPVRLRGRLRDSAGRPSAESRLPVTLTSPDGSTRQETMTLAGGPGSGRYDRWLTLPPGEYRITPASQKVDTPSTQPAAGGLTVRVQQSPEQEMQNLAGDDRLLRRLADATGGQSYAPEQLVDLPAHLAAQAVERPMIAETRLWDSPYLFAFVLACLGLEWAVRKQAGLA